MTINTFKNKVKTLLESLNQKSLNIEETNIMLLFENHQEDSIENEYVTEIGFDDTGDMYIDFESNCRAYTEDLTHNNEDCWDELYEEIKGLNNRAVDAVLTINLERENRDELVSKLEHIIKELNEGYNYGEFWDIEIQKY